MAMKKAPTGAPTNITELRLTLARSDKGSAPPQYRATYSVSVEYPGGATRTINGDLVPELTGGQISALRGFVDNMFSKAESEVL